MDLLFEKLHSDVLLFYGRDFRREILLVPPEDSPVPWWTPCPRPTETTFRSPGREGRKTGMTLSREGSCPIRGNTGVNRPGTLSNDHWKDSDLRAPKIVTPTRNRFSVGDPRNYEQKWEDKTVTSTVIDIKSEPTLSRSPAPPPPL